ncbi:MAG: hypothetical protein AAFP04_16230 [Myxococcota bacterium]
MVASPSSTAPAETSSASVTPTSSEAKGSTPAVGKAGKKPASNSSGAERKSQRARSSQTKKSASGPHASRVETMLGELNDLIDEHEAELREVKERVHQASVRSNLLRKLANKAVKEAAHNPELEAELAAYRKKFESLRSLMG